MSLRVWRIAVAALWVAVLGSSLAVVYGKHQARTRFIDLQRLTVERDELDIEWGSCSSSRAPGGRTAASSGSRTTI